jgi:hypothetical protein
LKGHRIVLLISAVAIAVRVIAGSVLASSGHKTASRPPKGLTTYGKTIWELDALLHDTFGDGASPCLRQGPYAADNFTRRCGSLAETPRWEDLFKSASHSRFTLVRLKRAPALGNVVPVAINGRYVFCGSFPTAWSTLASHSHRKWLVVLHGWVLTPFTCLG